VWCFCYQLMVKHLQAVNYQVCSNVPSALTMHYHQYTSAIVDISYVLNVGQRLRSAQHADLQLVRSNVC